MNPADVLKTRPEKVALLGLGASIYDYVAHVSSSHGRLKWDEIWALNMGAPMFRHDKLFVMDDLRVQAEKFPDYGRILAQHDKPIITSTPYPEYPQAVSYPLDEVLQKIGDDYFTNTVCYALGYAILIGVKEITLYGCDFHYPDSLVREEGGQNCAYLLGMGRYFGMKYQIGPSTTLLGAYHAKEVDGVPRRPLYGYVKQPIIPEEKKQEEMVNAAGYDGQSLRESEGDAAVPGSADQQLHQA